jgi:hypothetical protein
VAGACVGGGLCRASGTSFAAATVSGVAGLLMSVDVEAGLQPSGARIRKILLGSAVRPQSAEVESTHLAGRLDVSLAFERIKSLAPQGEENLANRSSSEEGPMAPRTQAQPGFSAGADPIAFPPGQTAAAPAIAPAHEDCGCGCGGGSAAKCTCAEAAAPRIQLVYAIGALGVSYVSEARRDSIWRILNEPAEEEGAPKKARRRGTKTAEQDDDGVPRDEESLVPLTDENLARLLESTPYLTQSVVWTLSRGETPMYAILPSGAFANETYGWLLRRWTDPLVDFVAIPGMIAGKITLYDGTQVDAIVPERRGMVSWNTRKYVDALRRAWKDTRPGVPERTFERDVQRFLDKIFFSIRNRGMSASERAINAAATNAFNISEVIVEAGAEGLSFRDVSAERSPVGRPGGDSYDVLLTFFDPARRLEKAPLRARFTVDVSDTVPVVIGKPESWYEY